MNRRRRHAPPMLGDTPRILIIATQQIGDVLLTTPLIAAVRARWPHATIDVLGHPGTLGMLSGNPDVSRTIEAPAKEGWRPTLARLRGLWRRYDLALITRPGDRPHFFGFAAARVRCGVVPPESSTSWWKRALCLHAVVGHADSSAVDEKLALIQPWLGPELAQRRFEVVPPLAQALPAALTDLLHPAPVVVHAPSMWRYKQWPAAHYAKLVDALLAAGHQVLLSGGPGAHDRAIVNAVLGALQRPAAPLVAARQLVDLCGALSLNQLTALFQRTALYVGPDTAITHLAAACGTPVVALFGPTNLLAWGPRPRLPRAAEPLPRYVRRQPEQRVGTIWLLQGEARCAPGVPCGRAGCEDHTASASLCLEEGLPPQRAIEAARVRLQGIAPPFRA